MIFRTGPGSVLNAISRMSPPHPGHSSGNSSPARVISFARASRGGASERGFALESQQPSAACAPPVACPPGVISPGVPDGAFFANAVTAVRSLWFHAHTPW
jgi:hypothetical protein